MPRVRRRKRSGVLGGPGSRGVAGWRSGGIGLESPVLIVVEALSQILGGSTARVPAAAFLKGKGEPRPLVMRRSPACAFQPSP